MPTQTFDIAADGDDGGCFFFQPSGAWPPNGGGSTFTADDDGDDMWTFKQDLGSADSEADVCFMRWPTGDVIAGGTPTAATLKVYAMSKVNSGSGFSVVGDYYTRVNPGGPSVAADWSEGASPSIFTGVAIPAITVGDVNNFTLTDLSGINTSPGGYTGIRMTLSPGDPPAGNTDYVQWATREHATFAAPQLDVTWDAAPAAGVSLAWITAMRRDSWKRRRSGIYVPGPALS